MSRSTKKGPYVDPRILKKVMDQKKSGDKQAIKTWSRACQIAPEFVGHTFQIHNGKQFIEIFVSETRVFNPETTFLKISIASCSTKPGCG